MVPITDSSEIQFIVISMLKGISSAALDGRIMKDLELEHQSLFCLLCRLVFRDLGSTDYTSRGSPPSGHAFGSTMLVVCQASF